MKRWVLPLLLFVSPGFSQEQNAIIIGKFLGLNNTDSPAILPDGQAQDLLNVDISPGGTSLKKRKGYGTAFTLSDSTSPVHGVYHFYDSDGSDVALYFNGKHINRSVSGAVPEVIYSSATDGATWQCVDSEGYAYCANTARDGIFKIDATETVGMLTGFTSTGTMVAVTPERLVQAGFEDFPNRVDFSKPNDFNTWTPGSTNADPIRFTITSPGSGIKHIVYAHGRVYAYKDSSFAYIQEGPTSSQLTLGDGWEVRTLNNFIGTLHNTSIFRDDILYFQGQDGHFYGWDGSSLMKLSRDIQQTIDETQGRTSGSWTQTSQANFEDGILDQSNASAGTVRINSTDTVRLDYSTTTTSECQIGGYTGPYYTAQQFISTRAFSLTSITVKLEKIGNPGDAWIRILNDGGNSPGTLISSAVIDTSGLGSSSQSVTSVFTSSVSLSANTSYWFQLQIVGAGSGDNRYDMQHRSDATNGNWYRSCATILDQAAHYWFQINEQVYRSSGIYSSAVNHAPDLTAWDQFSVTSTNGDGTHSFYIRSSTGIFYATATSPSWTAIGAGDVPTISTNPYFQVRDIMLAASTPVLTSPTLESFTQQWFEGSAAEKFYAVYHDNANWWAVASGTGASSNNKILKHDLLNNQWLIYDIPMNGMYVRNQSFYFGSPSEGKVFVYGDSESDDGSAIDAYWESKDYPGDAPFLEKDYWNISVAGKGVENSSMTVTYTINGSSASAITIPMSNGSDTYVNRNLNLPLGTKGKTISLKFGNNAAGQPFEVFGAQIGYSNRRWRPE